jgi:hypothetical protein
VGLICQGRRKNAEGSWKILFQGIKGHLSKGTEENNSKSRPRFELVTSRTILRSVTGTAKLLGKFRTFLVISEKNTGHRMSLV